MGRKPRGDDRLPTPGTSLRGGPRIAVYDGSGATLESARPRADRGTGLVLPLLSSAKAALGTRLIILGHHYQRDEVIKFADYTGDSFELSRFAAAQKGSSASKR